MKKYIKPEVAIVDMELQPMMAASMPVKDTEVNSDMSKPHGDTFGFDIWGEDED